jgi:hypothetical protein
MSQTPLEERLLSTVQASPMAVAVHDRAAWVDLFASDGAVNDPVGSAPHVGTDAIGRFYDTFIARSTIRFHVDHDLVVGMSVLRDLTLETTLSGVTLHVPAHLRYVLVEDGDTLKISELHAHWELPAMVTQMLKAGWPGIRASVSLSGRMLSNQGIRGAAGFGRGFRRVGKSGRDAVAAVLDAVGRADTTEVTRHLGGNVTLEMPAGVPVSVDQFVARATGLRWRKLISAGSQVTASVTIGEEPGIALFDLASDHDRIDRVRIFIKSA